VSATDLIAVDTATVISAGRETARTAEVWESWASRCAYAHTELGNAVRDARIALAISGYAQEVAAEARQVGQQVAALGGDTSHAGVIVDRTDLAAASLLSRPVNGRHAPR
jgi:hypothetical protein